MIMEQYKTSDLALSAALISYNFKLESMEKEKSGRFYFIFNKTNELETFIQEFWLKKLYIEPISYYQNIKFLKNTIHSS